uniref:CCHC-type domain-containing protein n=1 Tax=Tanacetum cinerariifolium TaxID=118510 RepID=A0A6L2MAT8_TANCI|nr:hypothetical protein [Tanacetum cinerariifolium]
MHNNIMAAGSRDRPPMLATERYVKEYSKKDTIGLKPDKNEKRPHQPTTVTILAVPATADSPAVPERTTVETILTMSPKNKAHYESEKEAIHLLLTRIRDEIYSTVYACKTAHEMWIDIERLQQVSSTTSIRMVKYQKEVNEIRVERIAKNANPLALVDAALPYLDPYHQAPKSHKPYAPTSKQSSFTKSNASTKFKGKVIAKTITPPSELASEEDNDPEQAERDKDIQKILALIAKYFKKIYKPTNNNLRTSLNSKSKNVDTTPRYKNDNQTGQFRNQRTITVVGARETVVSQVVQQTGIQCFNCKEFGHFDKECRKLKMVKDSTYHKENMLLCKQAEKGVPLQAEQADWLEDTDEEIDSETDTKPLEKVQNDAKYNVFANVRQHSKQPESTSNTCLVENDDSNVTPDSPDMCENNIQTNQNAKDERSVLVNLIANLKLDVDENKKIQKQLKKANASLAHELKECKSILAETSRTLGESNSLQDSCLISLKNKQTEFERYKALNDRIVDYDKLERIVKEKTKVITDLKLKEEKDIDKMISMEKHLKFLNEIVYKRNQSIQTIHMLAPKGPTFNAWEKLSHNHFRAPTALDMKVLIKTCLMPLAIKTQNDSFTFVHELQQEMHADLKYVESLVNEIDELESDKAEF